MSRALSLDYFDPERLHDAVGAERGASGMTIGAARPKSMMPCPYDTVRNRESGLEYWADFAVRERVTLSTPTFRFPGARVAHVLTALFETPSTHRTLVTRASYEPTPGSARKPSSTGRRRLPRNRKSTRCCISCTNSTP